MACTTDSADLFADGEWLQSIQCWLTGGGDPALQVVVPTVVFGTILVGLFIVGSSPLIPIVVAIILGGVILVAMPAGAMQIMLLALLAVVTIGGVVMTWRFGR